MNNVNDPSHVLEAAGRLVDAGVLTSVVLVVERLDRALAHYGLTAGDFGRGLWYSSAELVGLLECETKYLLHYASDVAMGHRSDWCVRGIELLRSDPRVAVVNPVWNGRLAEVRRESVDESGRHALGRGFSDHCYLVEADRFRKADLAVGHPASDRYPEYGGELFEKRVDSWMRGSGLLRATDLSACYIHPVHDHGGWP